MKNRGSLVEVSHFCADRPHLSAVAEVWPDYSVRIVERTGWTHNRDYDELVIEAAKKQGA